MKVQQLYLKNPRLLCEPVILLTHDNNENCAKYEKEEKKTRWNRYRRSMLREQVCINYGKMTDAR